jgi:Tol biopolymer transport system component/DNA-binding winged helix-turn-helix (wHTH) protein
MNEGAQPANLVRFGVFEVDLRTQELRKGGTRIRLPAQSFQVIAMLLRQPGQLVTREELQHKLWPAESFGDFEHGLNAAVNRVREALGDSAENPKFVETLPRRGYRFIAAVEPDALNVNGAVQEVVNASIAEPATTSNVPEGGSTHTADPRRERTRWSPTAWLAVLLVSLVSAGALLYAHFGKRLVKGMQDQTQEEDVRVSPLTTLPGIEISPAFSPDGSQVAFGWNGGDPHSEVVDLYVKVVGSENAERLTYKPAGFIVPAWSPDGRNIALFRAGAEQEGLFLVSARGGPERKLADITHKLFDWISLSWSPDGRQLVYSGDGALQILTAETGAVRNLTLPSRCKQAYAPAFSPKSHTIAFTCQIDSGIWEVYTMPADGGAARFVTAVNSYLGSVAWSRDGERIIVAADPGNLRVVSKDGGKQRQLLFAQDASQPAVSPVGERLAYVQSYATTSILKVEIGPNAATHETVMAASTKHQTAPDISPNGEKIAFESERSGYHEVWVASLDGSNALQLSNFHSWTGTPKWSPDGRQIVFDSRESGAAALYLVDPETAVPRRIPIRGHAASVPSWSRDGKWIYFTTGQAKSEGLYKVSAQGGDASLVSTTPGYNVQESRDGKFLYFMSDEMDADIHVKDAISGEERPLAGMPRAGFPTEWTLASTGIFYIDRASTPASIAFFEFASAKVTRRISIESPLIWSGLSISPDGKWFSYTREDGRVSDLMLAEGFH